VTSPLFRVESLGEHDRSTFSCGVAALDQYFRTQATQDIRRRVANSFVLIEASTNGVAAYYTLSMASVVMTDLPPELVKRLPRYPSLPAARIGRLAVDERFRGKGLGGAMLADAATRILESSAAAYALVVDAKDESAVRFYEHHGFRRFDSLAMSLFLPLETARKAMLST
jgi:ribosomal protein S18 acetylase RimI-like enzyme